MAATAKLYGILSVVYCTQILFNSVLAFDSLGSSHFNPSTNLLNVQEIDGSYIQNEDLSKTSYHIVKRSVVAPPIKKATSLIEKKVQAKSTSTESTLQKVISSFDSKSKEENSTLPLNSTEIDVSSTQTNVSSEKYNVSTTKPSSTEAASSTTTTTTTTTTPSSTTAVSTTSTLSTTLSDIVPPTKPSNITNTTVDHHIYYNSTMLLDADKALAYWVDFSKLPQDKVVVHRMLSDSHRKAATVSLSFDFPFYGHPLRNITIATGGFVYMGDYMHSWLAATQYIAPLMANFDTSLSSESVVQYFDNGTAFVIEWHNVTLQDERKGGNFTFQTILLDNGDIVFVYKEIPVSVTEIGDEAHPVKVGLSDAYVIDRMIYFIRRKTIYEYHRIDMKSAEIRNNTAIYFNALITCMRFPDCKSCMNADVGSECIWCESAKRCSDGLDRLRQDWLQSKCDVLKHSVNCSSLPVPDPFVQPLTVAEESTSMGVGSVIAVLLILAMVMGGLVWVGYAYKNPHTSSGQLLIRYRPSQWRFRSGEARYTAASVHM
ncbi:plexin domain-containing protein 2-like isoform X2 [Argiope bruennichi]|uniref:plexin domain-containing protein 2-like isoform X2 n=1 Tax=Argiope bruennichi TaxID=94029 RepID=UPI002493EFF6|nr:plexin domain-containing protein 2-like isoform X2 [Argiope bruennichi]